MIYFKKLLRKNNAQIRYINDYGYVAISSILVIMVIVFFISTSVSILSVNEIQSSFSNKQASSALYLVEGCIEDALLRINEEDSLPNSISMPLGTCSVTINSQSNGIWDFIVSGSLNSYNKSIHIVAERNNVVEITNWIEE